MPRSSYPPLRYYRTDYKRNAMERSFKQVTVFQDMGGDDDRRPGEVPMTRLG